MLDGWRRLRQRAGRRGQRLRAMAVLAVFYGISLATTHSGNMSQLNAYFDTIVPLDAWAIGWIAVGLVCTVYGFRHDDRIGWVVLDAMIVLWAGLCFVGFLTEDVQLSAVAVWAVLARLVWIDATEPHQRGGDDHDAD